MVVKDSEQARQGHSSLLPDDSPPANGADDLASLPDAKGLFPNAGALAGQAMADTDWAPITEILPQGPPSAPYPLPAAIELFVRGVRERSGASMPTSSACVLAALNLLCAHDANVLGLARRPIPVSLFIAVIARTGWRKSSAFNDTFAGHYAGDDMADTAWEESSSRRSSWESAQRDDRRANRKPLIDDVEEPPAATVHAPVALRQSTTLEALFKRLMLGRPTQVLGLDEAGVLIQSWAFRSDQIAKTAAELSTLWDGTPLRFDRVKDNVEIALRERRLTMIILGQPDIMLPVILGPAASNGLSARLLVSADDARPLPPDPFDWPAGSSADYEVERLEHLILRERRRQDANLDLASTSNPQRHTLPLSPEAQDLLEDFSKEAIARSDLDTGIHQRGWWVRAPEQSTRIAATLAVVSQSYVGGVAPGDAFIEQKDMADAIALTNWHGEELDRLAQRQAAHEDALAVESMVKLMRERLAAGDALFTDLDGCLVKEVMTKYARVGASHLRGDTDARRRVLDLMVEYDIVRAAIKRGRFHLNPGLRRPANTANVAKNAGGVVSA